MSEKPAPDLDELKNRIFAIRDAAIDALAEIERCQETKTVKWGCEVCGQSKHFTRAVTVKACGRCSKCQGEKFAPVW